ncbi:DUF4870 domain-containing protein [Luteolibacter sp. AS25]|uniref:DUF4870 domain-containing protein n=1 Tax=Luteolibacter sp. AS25 TaxID=3135776 RepID=UPI00398B10A4
MENDSNPTPGTSPPLLPAIQQTPPPVRPSGSDNLLIIFCHVSVLLGVGLLVPLIVYIVSKDDSPEVAYHAKEALNFHISILIYSLICVITCVGIILIIPLSIGSMVLAILATIAAAEGKRYEYPMTMRLVS